MVREFRLLTILENPTFVNAKNNRFYKLLYWFLLLLKTIGLDTYITVYKSMSVFWNNIEKQANWHRPRYLRLEYFHTKIVKQ